MSFLDECGFIEVTVVHVEELRRRSAGLNALIGFIENRHLCVEVIDHRHGECLARRGHERRTELRLGMVGKNDMFEEDRDLFLPE